MSLFTWSDDSVPPVVEAVELLWPEGEPTEFVEPVVLLCELEPEALGELMSLEEEDEVLGVLCPLDEVLGLLDCELQLPLLEEVLGEALVEEDDDGFEDEDGFVPVVDWSVDWPATLPVLDCAAELLSVELAEDDGEVLLALPVWLLDCSM